MPRPHPRSLPRRLAAALAVATLASLLAACSGEGDATAPEGWPSSLAEALTPEQLERIAEDPVVADLPPVLANAVVGSVTRPRNPRGAVARLVAAEDAIDDRSTQPRVLRAAGHLEQVAYRVLGRRPAWDERVRRMLPARLRGRLDANVASRREFRALHGDDLSDTLPAWRIVRPAPAARLRSFYRAAERRFDVEWEYLAAINLIETAMGRIRGTSVAGAQGPMQFIPTTWDIYGRGDINDPHDAIMAAARYLDARGFGDQGGRAGALYSYNNSNRYVRGVSLLAEQMKRRPRAFLGYYHWKVYYRTDRGDIRLPVGYASQRPVPVAAYLRDPAGS